MPYILLILGTVVLMKMIDWLTDTSDELEAEKQELLIKVNEYKSKWEDSEKNRILLQNERDTKDKIIEAYENENYSVIDSIRIADNEQLDKHGAALLGRLRERQR